MRHIAGFTVEDMGPGHYFAVATSPTGRISIHVQKNDAGFSGRQWEMKRYEDDHGNVSSDSGQFGTMKAAFEAARYRLDREFEFAASLAERQSVEEQRPGRWTAWRGDVIIGVSNDRIEKAVEIADTYAGKTPRSTGEKFVVTNSIGITAYTTTANGPELPTPEPGTEPESTRIEMRVTRLLVKAEDALATRDYERLQAVLTEAAFAANSLRLLGPYGVDSIPVDASKADHFAYPETREPIDEVEAYRG